MIRKPITFASVKVYCLITLICLTILNSHIAQLLLIRKFYCFRPGPILPLNMRGIIIYVARWWEKYPSKRSLIKHTCSWPDKLILLWTSENIFRYYKFKTISWNPRVRSSSHKLRDQIHELKSHQANGNPGK